MKYYLEIQTEGFNIEAKEIVNLVKDSLKAKKLPVSKVEDLKIYYNTKEKVIYYVCQYKEEEFTGQIYCA